MQLVKRILGITALQSQLRRQDERIRLLTTIAVSLAQLEVPHSAEFPKGTHFETEYKRTLMEALQELRRLQAP